MAEIFDSQAEWQAQYESSWLAHYEGTGEIDWSLYPRPRNREAVGGPGVDLRESRLLFVTSAGAYLPTAQERYDDENDMGDYSIRAIPSDTPLDAIALRAHALSARRRGRRPAGAAGRCATWRRLRGRGGHWRAGATCGEFHGLPAGCSAPRGGNGAANRRLCQRSGRARRAARAGVDRSARNPSDCSRARWNWPASPAWLRAGWAA